MENVFAVYDSKVEAYLRPFFEATPGSAIRAFEGACTPEHAFGQNPHDFTLHWIGTWDAESGVLEAKTAVHIASAHEIVIAKGNS